MWFWWVCPKTFLVALTCSLFVSMPMICLKQLEIKKKMYFQTTTAVIDRYMIVLIYMLVMDFCNHSYLLKSSWQHFWTTTSVPLKSETLNNPTQSMGGTKRIPGKNKVQPCCSMFFWWKCAIIKKRTCKSSHLQCKHWWGTRLFQRSWPWTLARRCHSVLLDI